MEGATALCLVKLRSINVSNSSVSMSCKCMKSRRKLHKKGGSPDGGSVGATAHVLLCTTCLCICVRDGQVGCGYLAEIIFL